MLPPNGAPVCPARVRGGARWSIQTHIYQRTLGIFWSVKRRESVNSSSSHLIDMYVNKLLLRCARPSTRHRAWRSTRTPPLLRMLKSVTRWRPRFSPLWNCEMPGVQEVLWVCQVWIWHREGNVDSWSHTQALLNHQLKHMQHTSHRKVKQSLLSRGVVLNRNYKYARLRCAPTSQWRSATRCLRRFSRSCQTQPVREFHLRPALLITVSLSCCCFCSVN